MNQSFPENFLFWTQEKCFWNELKMSNDLLEINSQIQCHFPEMKTQLASVQNVSRNRYNQGKVLKTEHISLKAISNSNNGAKNCFNSWNHARNCFLNIQISSLHNFTVKADLIKEFYRRNFQKSCIWKSNLYQGIKPIF